MCKQTTEQKHMNRKQQRTNTVWIKQQIKLPFNEQNNTERFEAEKSEFITVRPAKPDVALGLTINETSTNF